MSIIIDEDDPRALAHYGILRKSGRYPWGSGDNAEQRGRSFLGIIAEMKAAGMKLVDIARSFSTEEYPFNTTDLKVTTTLARQAVKAADIATAQRYKEQYGYSNVAIGEKMGINESSVRALLAPGAADKLNRQMETANMLRRQVAEKGMIDVGKGNEHHLLGVNASALATAVATLKAEGYEVINVQVPNLGSAGKKTLIKVLAPEGTQYKDVVKDLSQIKTISEFSDDNGRSFSEIKPPLSVNSKRIAVRYAEDGGTDADGVIYVRPGVSDLSMGGSNYAQVRIAVDGTHYLKGMAMYKNDLPDGVDLMFNTNKSDTGNKLDAMKPLKVDKATGELDELNPFGSIVRQLGDRNEKGEIVKVTSAMNLVNEEGDWDKWSKSLSAQMLSKQSHSLIKERLDATFAEKKANYDEIMALTNPAVKKKLLESYADDLDAAAVHLKAAGLPRQRTQVILPMNSMKPNEVYAPNFDHGERVVLIRYPHGGKFEIPELVVNNNHREAKSLLGQAADAIGIHSKVAEQLSGADFDGDTVVVIPNNHNKVQTKHPLKELEGFDPRSAYPRYDGMPKLSPTYKNKLMGDVSNLITDMTIKGAADHEIAQAVKHSMVVIDAEKHDLNWRQSALDHNISSLKKKYQDNGDGGQGASTLISQKKSPIRVPERRLRKASEGGPIDPATGKKVYVETGVKYVNKDGKTVEKTTRIKKLEYHDDAHDLSSGTPKEKLYADYSNRMKDMANAARKASLETGKIEYSESAARVYSREVASLKGKLNVALENAPRERTAQVAANAKVAAIVRENPPADKAERKKIESLALMEARNRVGAKKTPVHIEDAEWDAIQAGAVRPSVLDSILTHAEPTRVRELATPKTKVLMTTSKVAKAQRLLASGNLTQAEVASMLGVSLSTLKRSL